MRVEFGSGTTSAMSKSLGLVIEAALVSNNDVSATNLHNLQCW